MIDFTLSAYELLLDSIRSAGYRSFTMKEWMENGGSEYVVIRHDVDRRAGNALSTARLEKTKGIKATYYFRMTKGSFKEDIIRQISEMGHEIGYHYEDLSRNNGNYENAMADFKSNLGKLRSIAEISTIAMHGKPSSGINNLDMWKNCDCSEFGLTGEAYLTPDYSDVYYFSDTGRSWKGKTKTNYRDLTGGMNDDNVRSTADLVNFIRREKPGKIVIMTHPERWNGTFTGYSYYLLRDSAINLAKTILRPVINHR